MPMIDVSSDTVSPSLFLQILDMICPLDPIVQHVNDHQTRVINYLLLLIHHACTVFRYIYGMWIQSQCTLVHLVYYTYIL
jgi:hypothetical protein